MTVLAAHLLDGRDGKQTVHADHSYRETWRVHTNADDLLTASHVLTSALLPQRGDPYRKWQYDAVTDVYSPLAVEDQYAVVVHREARQDPEARYTWLVEVAYEGVNDPTAKPPKPVYGSVTYQEPTVQDIYGRLITNSALDPFEAGVTRDADRERITITRAVPYDAWNPHTANLYRHTTNFHPWQYPGPKGPLTVDVPVPATPLLVPPGCAKLSELSAEPVEQSANPVPANSKWYWEVRAVVDVDYAQFKNNEGVFEYVRWRAVNIDQGYHELRLVVGKFIKVPIMIGTGRQPTSPQLLNGSGKSLKQIGPPPALSAILPGAAGTPLPNHDYYATTAGTTLVVPAPGVLANDVGATSATLVAGSLSPAVGTLTFNTDGSFTYAPDAGFVGWVTFRYLAVNGSGSSNPATVVILVGDRPRVIVSDRYVPTDWSPIASLLGAW